MADTDTDSTQTKKRPVVLIIRDGWGINPSGEEGKERDANATLLAQTPYHEHLYATYPQATLSASGPDVGLPEGQMGNSEVGHLNLGAGRVIYQDIQRINKAIAENTLGQIDALQEACDKARGHRLHFMGLVSDGGVHSHQDHLIALTKIAAQAGVEDIMIHAITDGRDTSPTGGKDYLRTVQEGIAGTGATISTVIGRYFAMDRDKRWDRNKLAWDALVFGRGETSDLSACEAVAKRYEQNETDEFLKPVILSHADEQRINDGDVVIWFNFRADRARQLSIAFLRDDFDGFDREVHPNVHFVTMTEYDETYGCPVLFPPESYPNVLGKVVAEAGLTQLRIAETEKYPHVTYFFNGGEEVAFEGEDREIIPSPQDVPTYDHKPEMSAEEVTDTLVPKLGDYDMVILNFANPDMVGHTGVVEAAIKACETIDACTKRVLEKVLELGGCALVTADHGNSEYLRNPDGSPHTAHTTNLVHFIYVGKDADQMTVESGILGDVAPTLLHLLGVPQSREMTGHSLVSRKK